MGLRFRFLLPVLMLMLTASVAAAATSALQPAMMPLGNETDRLAGSAARMVDAILEFTKWPVPPPVVRLCVAGAVRHAGHFGEISLANGTRVRLTTLRTSESPADCDAVYFGGLDAIARRNLITGAHGAAMVTITEDDAECRSGAMFCLIFAPNALNFELNVDAVSRSAVRIDPRVLRMAKGGY